MDARVQEPGAERHRTILRDHPHVAVVAHDRQPADEGARTAPLAPERRQRGDPHRDAEAAESERCHRAG
jgi:hypothetical protein